MSKSITSEELDEIFGVPANGSNIKEEQEETQEGSYAEVLENSDTKSFDQKAKDLDLILRKDAPPSDVEFTSKEEVGGDAKSREPILKQPSNTSFEEILSKSIPNKPATEQIIPEVATKQNAGVEDAVNSTKKQDTQEICNDSKPNVLSTSDSSVSQNLNEWLLTSPSAMFDNFYKQKAIVINHITGCYGRLNIAKLNAELRISYISTSVELHDLEGMALKLTQIQDYLDRVVLIKSVVTSQSIVAHRGVELLRGVLAGVVYEKPASVKQEGINFIHMRDIEFYAQDLSALEQNAKDVYNNLLEAKEILSRKISIAIELFKEDARAAGLDKNFSTIPDSVKKTLQNQNPKSALSMQGYDQLDASLSQVKVRASSNNQPNNKTGTIEWG